MKKNKLSLTLALAFVLCCLFATSAVGGNFGFQVSQESISHTDDIHGGSYLYLSMHYHLSTHFTINVKYSVDVAPYTFDDHLLSAGMQYYMGDYEIMNQYIGVYYLKNASQDADYIGIKGCILSTGFSNVSIDFLPISYYYNSETKEKFLAFEIMSLGGKF